MVVRQLLIIRIAPYYLNTRHSNESKIVSLADPASTYVNVGIIVRVATRH